MPDERGDDTDRHRAPREPAEDASASQGGASIAAGPERWLLRVANCGKRGVEGSDVRRRYVDARGPP